MYAFTESQVCKAHAQPTLRWKNQWHNGKLNCDSSAYRS